MEVEQPEVQGHSRFHSSFENSLGSMTFCQSKNFVKAVGNQEFLKHLLGKKKKETLLACKEVSAKMAL